MSEAHKNIGDKLKARREGLNLSLEDVSEETKISLEYLQSIENGQIDAFPSPVYYDMFARSYAKEMEMNVDELFEELKAKTEALPDADAEKVVAPAPVHETKDKINNGFSFIKLAAWLAGIIIVIFIIIVIWAITTRKNDESSSVQPTPNTIVAEPDSTELTFGDLIKNSSNYSSSESEINLPEFESVKPMILKVSTKDSCWVMVLADGDTVLNKNLAGGVIRELTAADRFLVSAGNPGALEISLDGRILKPLSASGRPYRDREINRTNMKDYLAEPEEIGDETP